MTATGVTLVTGSGGSGVGGEEYGQGVEGDEEAAGEGAGGDDGGDGGGAGFVAGAAARAADVEACVGGGRVPGEAGGVGGAAADDAPVLGAVATVGALGEEEVGGVDAL